MHTVGHPAEHAPAGLSAAGAPAGMPAASAHGGAHGDHEAPEPVGAASSALPHAFPAAGPTDAAPMSGMDPMAVCLAVLSTWAVTLLALRLLGPGRARPFSGRATGVRPPLLPWPNPPPRRTVLATLSVLRI
ncbi:hypothetical protein F0344_27145 [Streptomyces finlayi]|uniref:Uncharacterized protein n=2 Tax=Streptomyces finlayi TaxID=67296 RepID=A0A7G7BVU2_9ACTN|nr:hypothetical protein F0344_27145 [Streptomyces finlayi]